MEKAEKVNRKLASILKTAENLKAQYAGLEEFEEKLKLSGIRLSVKTLTYDGYKYFAENVGGRLVEDFGINDLDDVIKTLLIASITKRKKEIERYFSKMEKELELK